MWDDDKKTLHLLWGDYIRIRFEYEAEWELILKDRETSMNKQMNNDNKCLLIYKYI